MKIMKVIFFIFLCFFEHVITSKILFISPSLSNSITMQTGRLADILHEQGHNVTFFIPEQVSINQKNGTKLAKVIRMKNFTDGFLQV
jgi:hypothetical protein